MDNARGAPQNDERQRPSDSGSGRILNKINKTKPTPIQTMATPQNTEGRPQKDVAALGRGHRAQKRGPPSRASTGVT